jgi:PIN domain nuclease of toxin-antitoxin system
MSYLLDTHTFLWVLFDDDKLSDKAKYILSDADNEVYVSLISYWEISLKYSIGKLELRGIRPDELPQKAGEIEVISLDISQEDMASFYKLPRTEHKDPFDRLIIWQAIRRNLVLISKDKKFDDYQDFGLRTLW